MQISSAVVLLVCTATPFAFCFDVATLHREAFFHFDLAVSSESGRKTERVQTRRGVLTTTHEHDSYIKGYASAPEPSCCFEQALGVFLILVVEGKK